MQYLKKNRLSPNNYVDGILAGDKVVLSKAITLIESYLSADQSLALEVLESILPYSGNSRRIGITGVPGVGKSTFIEALGKFLIKSKARIAILAVDPSSKKTKGSILGDKTRMPWLSNQTNVFIRPSAAGNSLGGVAHRTRESMVLCEAAGYDTIMVETVGVGQSETEVHGMVDFFLLLMLSGAGDELQGIKKGIMEMADAIIITKADGDNCKAAEQARVTYESALHLVMGPETNWTPPVMTCSAIQGLGLEDIWRKVLEHRSLMQENGLFESKRADQRLVWMHDCIRLELDLIIKNNPPLGENLKLMEERVREGAILPGRAAHQLIHQLIKS